MKTAQKHFSACIDWSAVKGDARAQMATAIAGYTKGVRGRRVNSVTRKQIVAFFHGTPAAFVEDGIDRALEDGLITIERSTPTAYKGDHRRRYVYSPTPRGESVELPRDATACALCEGCHLAWNTAQTAVTLREKSPSGVEIPCPDCGR